MCLEVTGIPKRFSTFLTAEWMDIQVDPSMLSCITSVFHRQATKIASEHPVIPFHIFTDPHAIEDRNPLVASWTLQSWLSFIAVHVVPHKVGSDSCMAGWTLGVFGVLLQKMKLPGPF